MNTDSRPEGAETVTTVTHHHETITAPDNDPNAPANGIEKMDTSDTDGTDRDDNSQRENSTDLDSSASTLNSQAEPKEERALSAEEAAKHTEARSSMQEGLVNATLGLGPRRKRKTAEELKNLSTRNYLDETVVPVLLTGMSELARARPENPLTWLSKYLERAQHREDGAEGGGGATSADEEERNAKRANASNSIAPEIPPIEPAGGDTSS